LTIQFKSFIFSGERGRNRTFYLQIKSRGNRCAVNGKPPSKPAFRLSFKTITIPPVRATCTFRKRLVSLWAHVRQSVPTTVIVHFCRDTALWVQVARMYDARDFAVWELSQRAHVIVLPLP
jgi:hypothetical protein